MASKMPAFQFYPADWLKDPDLQMCSFQTKGIWIDMLCAMWEHDPRGMLSGTPAEFCRLIGCTKTQFDTFLHDMQVRPFADCLTNGHGEVTIVNRRMLRDENARRAWRERKQKERGHAKVTDTSGKSPTVSSSSSSCPKGHFIYSPEFEEFWQTYPRRVEKAKAARVWHTRIKEGAEPGLLIKAAKLYAHAIKGEDPKFIKYPATFLGPDRHWEEVLTDIQEPQHRQLPDCLICDNMRMVLDEEGLAHRCECMEKTT